MEENRQRAFTVPLVELVIVVGIFALISVLIMKMFFSADKLRGNAVITAEETTLLESDTERLVNMLKMQDFDEAAASLGYALNDGVYTKQVVKHSKEQTNEYVMTLSDSEEVRSSGVLHNIAVKAECGEIADVLETAVYVPAR